MLTNNIVDIDKNSKANFRHIQFFKPSQECPLDFSHLLTYAAIAYTPSSCLGIASLTGLDRQKTIKPALQVLSEATLVEHREDAWIARPPDDNRAAWFRKRDRPKETWQSKYFYFPIYECSLDLTTRERAVYWAIRDYPGQLAAYYATVLRLEKPCLSNALNGTRHRKGLVDRGMIYRSGNRLCANNLPEDRLVPIEVESNRWVRDYMVAKMPAARDWLRFWDQRQFLASIERQSAELFAARLIKAKHIHRYWEWLFEWLPPDALEVFVDEHPRLLAHILVTQKHPGPNYLIGAARRVVHHMKIWRGSLTTYSIPAELFSR